MNFLFFITLSALLFRIYFSLKFKHALLSYVSTSNADFKEGVSVIISAKNEAENLKKYLPKILKQQYHTFEVIVVDDYSTDDTLQVLQSFDSHINLHILTKENFENIAGKKAAITAAIENSNYDYLLFTDADCVPASEFWISKMVRNFSEEKKIVLGVAPFFETNNWFSKFQNFEAFKIAATYLGFALNGKTYMAVGRNMAYHKSIFKDAGGFKDHLHLPSGDDDIIINKMATKNNVAIELSAATFCYSKPKNTLIEYLTQKSRHFSAAKYYKKENLLWLRWEGFMHIFFYLGLIIFLLFCNLSVPYIVMLVSLLGLYVQIEFKQQRILRKFRSKYNLLAFDFLSFILYIAIVFNTYFKKRGNW